MSELSDGVEPATRDQLIRAAIRVVGSRGLRGSTLRAIASEAGLTHGMIVHHFGTRDNLIRAALERAITVSLTGAIAEEDGQSPRLGDHIAEVAEDADGVVAFERELLNEAARNPEYRPYAVAMWERFERAISGQLTHRGVTDPTAVIVFSAAVDGLLRRHMDLQDDDSLESALTMLNDLADGLASRR
ncbi:TetR family transcriptional regulator [Microbacterium sp. ISL-103]|uniref:TetR/AcrR family transcriptional regulator n=1 Tax=Microbacterium sp. ISL-103 TaxID=2819156 RepID=UPI001BE9BC20|nr:TetR/AcrR family transcriptional regulator [Microbacterium sp. ISL-103]MBT2475823.1 TetR family transcriptional regulator [Microbacterium sp. ISL-103]